MSERQHTVPVSYLRGFSTPKRTLRAFDRQRQDTIPISVLNATVVGDIYRIPGALDEAEARMIETILSQREYAAAQIFKTVRLGGTAIGSEDQVALAEFIGLQWLRTMDVSDSVDEIGDWVAKMHLQTLTREDIAKRLVAKGMDASDSAVDKVLDFVIHPERFTAVPPKGSFLIAFLSAYEQIVPLLLSGWNWLVVRSSGRHFITSDAPVTLVGDTTNGHLVMPTAEEIWLPVGRRHAIVLTRDASMPPFFIATSDQVRLINQRIALECWRWLYWHPDDDGLAQLDRPPRQQKQVRIESIGWRKKPGGLIGEIIGFTPNRPPVRGERLLSGRLVVDRRATPVGLSSREEVMASMHADPA